MTTLLDMLSDTIYRDRAIELVDRFVADHGVHIPRSQIHGLKQIAMQQPNAIKSFASHQREKAQAKLDRSGNRKLESQIAFWKLIEDLCTGSNSFWSPAKEAESHLPSDLHENNIPKKEECKSNEDRARRNQLLAARKEQLDRWSGSHLPAFFQRFCTQYLYHLGKAEEKKSNDDRGE